MKKILIIEDDEFKANNIRSFILSYYNSHTAEVVSSLVEAIDAIDRYIYALIIIDMSIPSHPLKIGEGSPVSLLTGGIDVLLELNSLERQDPCVIITQYPDIEISGEFYSVIQAKDAIKNKLDCTVLSCIQYKEGDDEWKKYLKQVTE